VGHQNLTMISALVPLIPYLRTSVARSLNPISVQHRVGRELPDQRSLGREEYTSASFQVIFYALLIPPLCNLFCLPAVEAYPAGIGRA
jgi:hypothetical protein